MPELMESVISKYFESYRELIAAEPADTNSVILSFPFHYSANHRIELTVTAISERQFVISDMARTISELQDAGLRVGQATRKRLGQLAKIDGMRIVQDHLLLDSAFDDLGANIHRLLEAAKTIGDFYLVHRGRGKVAGRDLLGEIRSILNKRQVMYREKQNIAGQLEMNHRVDFLLPANGRPQTAIAVLPGHNSHLVAEAWGFKCDDIRASTVAKTEIGLIYDTSENIWEEESKKILEAKAAFAVPSDSLNIFEDRLSHS